MNDNITTLDQALEAYSTHFGTNYPLCIGKHHGTEKELIKNILSCINSDTPAPEPVYKDGCFY